MDNTLGYELSNGGSIPSGRTTIWIVISAVEYHIDIVKVTGSIPVQSTKQDFLGVAML